MSMKRRSWIIVIACIFLGFSFLGFNPNGPIGNLFAAMFLALIPCVILGGFALYCTFIFQTTRGIASGTMSPKKQRWARLGLIGAAMWAEKHKSGGVGSSGGFQSPNMHGPEN
jgi:hypothetical protein